MLRREDESNTRIKRLTCKRHTHVGIRVLVVDAQVIDVASRGLPARILKGDLSSGDEAGRKAGGAHEVGGRYARPAELAVEEAADQGVRENGGAGSAAAVSVGASEGAGALLVFQPASLDAVRRPRRAARRCLALLDLEELLPRRVCVCFSPIPLVSGCMQGFLRYIVWDRVGI